MNRRVPDHLKKYCVEQDYSRYTPEDQAVWRYIMRQLKNFLTLHAHPCYSEGLQKTGIEIDRIPSIDEMNKRLQEFGWGAVPVSGFIPPAAFMEFQANGILPIACDMRTLDHVLYTPAPDIVHEAAGHAPILIEPEFSGYLAKYAQVAANAILSFEDLKLYEAIRDLSDVKENPSSTPQDIKKCEKRLEATVKDMSFVSEAAYLGRMNWWTAEYGLIGSVKNPKLFGAGLLSSVGEAHDCLESTVKKIPLSVDCVKYSYDITEQQPQLFVTPDFKHLSNVLEDLAKTMAYRTGGVTGLEKAVQSKTVNTVELDSGLQISGQLVEYMKDGPNVYFIKFQGNCQLSVERQELPQHGRDYHAKGFSSPLGGTKKSIDWKSVKPGQEMEIEFISGLRVHGTLKSVFGPLTPQIATFENCMVKKGEKVLFKPDWGTFDMAIGTKVVSVFGGPADRRAYGFDSEFQAARVPEKNYSEEQRTKFAFFQKVRDAREKNQSNEFKSLAQEYLQKHSANWLLGLEIFELFEGQKNNEESSRLMEHLHSLISKDTELRSRIEDGLKLATGPNP